MFSKDDEDINWLLRNPDPLMKKGAVGALRIARADFEALGVTMPNLATVFWAGLLTSLPMFGVALLFATGGAPSLMMVAVFGVPLLLIYYLFGGALAVHAQPVNPSLFGSAIFAALFLILVLRQIAPNLVQPIAVLVALGAGLYLSNAYFRALRDPGFRTRTETVRAIQKNFNPADRSKALRDAHLNQMKIATFKAVLNNATDKANAFETVRNEIRTRTPEGDAEALRQLENQMHGADETGDLGRRHDH